MDNILKQFELPSYDDLIFENTLSFDDLKQELLLEAADAKKENIFQKIWNMILKALEFLGKGIREIIKKIKKFISNPKKSIGKVLQNMGLKRNESNKKINNEPVKGIVIDNTKLNDIEKLYNDSIPKDLFSHIKINYDCFVMKLYYSDAKNDFEYIPIKLTDEIIFIFNIFNSYNDLFFKLRTSFEKFEKDRNIVKLKYELKNINSLQTRISKMKKINYNVLDFYMQRLDDLYDSMEELKSIINKLKTNKSLNEELKDDKDILNFLNSTLNFYSDISKIIPKVVDQFLDIHRVPPAYYESIKSIDQLLKLIDEMIRMRIGIDAILVNCRDLCDHRYIKFEDILILDKRKKFFILKHKDREFIIFTSFNNMDINNNFKKFDKKYKLKSLFIASTIYEIIT